MEPEDVDGVEVTFRDLTLKGSTHEGRKVIRAEIREDHGHDLPGPRLSELPKRWSSGSER